MASGRDYPRALRVNEVLRQVVAEELERLSDADERLRLVTVTAVEVTTDLRAATVYVGTLGDDVADALEERRGQVQRALARQVRLKRTPRLRFASDPAVPAGARVDEILRRLGDERRAGPTAPQRPQPGAAGNPPRPPA